MGSLTGKARQVQQAQALESERSRVEVTLARSLVVVHAGCHLLARGSLLFGVPRQ